MSARKPISTSYGVVSCDVCGRTLLRGERADPFIAGGSRRMVCELCETRAANEGWIREGADNTLLSRARGGRSGRSFLDRLRSRADNGAESESAIASAPGRSRHDAIEHPSVVEADLRPEHRPLEVLGDEQPPATGDRSDGSQAERHVRAVPTNADLKMGRALDVFNASAHPRRVAGVARSLGTPWVAVLPSETEGAIVSIVVSWELCWYRYEVDLADEAAGVRVMGQGAELSELGAHERQPNAAADERGQLALPA